MYVNILIRESPLSILFLTVFVYFVGAVACFQAAEAPVGDPTHPQEAERCGCFARKKKSSKKQPQVGPHHKYGAVVPAPIKRQNAWRDLRTAQGR